MGSINPKSKIQNPKCVLASNMHIRPPLRILFGLTKYLARDRSRVTFPEQNISCKVDYRIALAPTKVDVRYLSGIVA